MPRLPAWLQASVEDHDKKIAKWLPPVSILLLVIWICISRIFVLSHAPAGTYIGILAFVAAVVTIWPPDSPWAKAAWFVIFGGLLALELNTLYEQRQKDEAQRVEDRKQEDDRFAGLLKSQQDSFAEVLRKNQQEFDSTIGRLEGIRRVASENLDELTGGKSFCFFLMNVSPRQLEGQHRLTLFVVGKHPMHNVSAQIQTVHTKDELDVTQQVLSMHGIPLGEGNFIPGAHSVSEMAPLGHYFILIFAANGYSTRNLKSR